MKTDQKIHFVTGKGGVGKSFFAATLAKALAQKLNDEGRNSAPILLAELASHSFYKDYLSIDEISFVARNYDTINVAQWSAEDCLKEYALHLLKIESLYKLFFKNPISKALIDIAPGLQELAILGKATSAPRNHGPKMNYSNIVFDSYATGHFLTLFRAPLALAQTIRFGPMGEQSRSIHDWICKPDYCHVHIVSLPEELPATESVELYQALQSEFGLKPKIYLNKYFNPSIYLSDLKASGSSISLKKHFDSIFHQQEKAEQIFKNAGLEYSPIPFVSETEPLDVIARSVEYLKDRIL